MTTLFIADLHLSESRPDISAAFERFVDQQAPNIDRLYVLGDLFEAWIGDDNHNHFIAHIKSLFQRLKIAGVELFFIHGNRDFLIGQRFAQETGMTLLAEHTVIELYNKRYLIMHGDTLCTDDIDYQKFRKLSRRKWWQRLMLSLPLSWRKRIAINARKKSQQQNGQKSEAIMDVNQHAVEAQMRQHQVTQLIHGHTHRPATHHFTLDGAPATRWVLGDWYEQCSWMVISPTEQSLHFEPLQANRCET